MTNYKSPDLRSDLNEEVELLTIVMEECAEVQQQCAKRIRFGRKANNFHLNAEIADLFVMLDIMAEYGIIDLDGMEHAKELKRNKLKVYSRLKV